MTERTTPRVVSEAEIRALATPSLALAATRDAFRARMDARSQSPTPLALEFADAQGEVHVKGGHLAESSTFAIKIASAFYRNARFGLPSGSGLSVVLSAETGEPLAILLDNGYLTDLRTGAAGALATDLLARREVKDVAILGAGLQARFQLEALLEVRTPERVRVHSRTPEHSRAFADEMQERHGLSVFVAEDADSAVDAADVVITVTPSRSPLFDGAVVAEGAHVTAVGSDMPEKRELDVRLFERAAIVAVDDARQARTLGETHHALEAGALDETRLVELTEVMLGQRRGRTADSDITIADLTGLGIQDAAIATAFYALLAKEADSR